MAGNVSSALGASAPPGAPAPLGGNILDTPDAAAAKVEYERRQRDPARPKITEEGYRAWVEQDATLFKTMYGTGEASPGHGTTAVAARPSDVELAEHEEEVLGLEPMTTDLRAYMPAGEAAPGRPFNQALIDEAAPGFRDLGVHPGDFHNLVREAVANEVAGPLTLEAESRLILEGAQRLKQMWGPGYETRLGKVWSILDHMGRLLPNVRPHLEDNRFRYSPRWMAFADDVFAKRQRVDDLRKLRKKHGRGEGA